MATIGLLAVACGDEAAELPPPETSTRSTSPPTTPAPPTTPVPTEEDQILAAYQGYWDTWLAANDPPDPDHPDLARYYTGRALAVAVSEIEGNATNEVVLRLPPASQFRFEVESLEVNGDEAVAQVCVIDDGHVIQSTTGEVLDGRLIASRVRVRLLRDGAWRISDHEYQATSEGQLTCIAA